MGVQRSSMSAHQSHLCDAIAIATLHELGGDPSRLMTGVEKITRYNLKTLETAVDDRNYPTLSERREFARAVTDWIGRESSGRSSQ